MPLMGHLRSLLGRKNRVPELSALQGTQAESLVEAVKNSETPPGKGAGTETGTGTVTPDERDALIETKLQPRRSRHVNSEDFQHAIASITEDLHRLEDQLKQVLDRNSVVVFVVISRFCFAKRLPKNPKRIGKDALMQFVADARRGTDSSRR